MKDLRFPVVCRKCGHSARRASIPPKQPCRWCGGPIVEVPPRLPGPMPGEARKVVYGAVLPETAAKLEEYRKEGNFKSASAAIASILDEWFSVEQVRGSKA